MSAIDGEQSIISVDGTCVKSPSDIRFDYTLDEDKCTLTVKKDAAVQTRRGEQNIKI